MRFSIPCFVIVMAMWAGLAAAQDKTVLVVESYHTGYAWVDDIDKGVKEALKDAGVKLEFFYMDTKRKAEPGWKKEAGDLACRKIEELKPVAVIVADDNAAELVAKPYAGKAGAPQFVFCGVNADPAKYGFPADNVTGILERAHFVETIDMFLKAKPAAKSVLMLSDNSETMQAVIAYCQTLKSAIPVTFKMVGTFDQWQAEVKAAEGKFDAILVQNYHTLKQTADAAQSMVPKDVMDWTTSNSKLPVIGLLPFNCDEGAVLGIAESGVEHGYMAGTMVKGIVGGKSAKDFPITTAKEGLVFVNLDAAKKIEFKVPYPLIKSAKLVVQPKG